MAFEVGCRFRVSVPPSAERQLFADRSSAPSAPSDTSSAPAPRGPHSVDQRPASDEPNDVLRRRGNLRGAVWEEFVQRVRPRAVCDDLRAGAPDPTDPAAWAAAERVAAAAHQAPAAPGARAAGPLAAAEEPGALAGRRARHSRERGAHVVCEPRQRQGSRGTYGTRASDGRRQQGTRTEVRCLVQRPLAELGRVPDAQLQRVRRDHAQDHRRGGGGRLHDGGVAGGAGERREPRRHRAVPRSAPCGPAGAGEAGAGRGAPRGGGAGGVGYDTVPARGGCAHIREDGCGVPQHACPDCKVGDADGRVGGALEPQRRRPAEPSHLFP